MARYVTSVRTSRSPAEAFAFMADVPGFARWDPGISHGAQALGVGLAVGSAFDVGLRQALG